MFLAGDFVNVDKNLFYKFYGKDKYKKQFFNYMFGDCKAIFIKRVLSGSIVSICIIRKSNITTCTILLSSVLNYDKKRSNFKILTGYDI